MLTAPVIQSVLPPAWNEEERLAALKRYTILDTPPEPDFDDLVRLAAQVCQTPVALITLVDERRQWFKAELGLGVRETPLVASICATAILQPGLFIVPDTTEDPRFAGNPLVQGEPHLRFYAGAVLRTPDGVPLGALCVLDCVPRDPTEEQASTLTTLARQVMSQLELRRALAERDEKLEAACQVERRQALLVRELHHRVKNTLATVQSISRMTIRNSKDMRAFEQAFTARLMALSATHNLLTESAWTGVGLHELLATELKPFQAGRVSLDGPPVSLTSKVAVALGMAVHELGTNAAKYGAFQGEDGSIRVRWSVSDGILTLDWREKSGRKIEPPTRQGFGSRLIQQTIVRELQGSITATYHEDGLHTVLTIPLSVDDRLVA